MQIGRNYYYTTAFNYLTAQLFRVLTMDEFDQISHSGNGPTQFSNIVKVLEVKMVSPEMII